MIEVVTISFSVPTRIRNSTHFGIKRSSSRFATRPITICLPAGLSPSLFKRLV